MAFATLIDHEEHILVDDETLECVRARHLKLDEAAGQSVREVYPWDCPKSLPCLGTRFHKLLLRGHKGGYLVCMHPFLR